MKSNAKPLLRDRAYIDGKWCTSTTNTSFDVSNPATGELLASLPNAGQDDVANAIAAAERALPAWRGMTGKERSAILRRWHALVIEHTEDLAAIMTAEQGKNLAEARGEIAYGASFIEWFAEEAKRVHGDVLPTPDQSKRMLVLKQAVGVCAAITPWNFPNAMITRKCAPALAAGCTIILKPAEQTPLSALALADLAERAGIPPGVLNIVTADREQSILVGKLLCQSPVVQHLSFTGSTQVGRILMQQCAPTVKKMALELGGHAPFIVFEDADLETAVQGAMASKYRNAGQACVCTNRFYVHDNLYDAFVQRLSEETRKLQVGHGTEPGVAIGPLIDEDAVQKVQRHVEDAVSRGARITVGGKRHSLGGTFFQPTVMADVTPDMCIMKEETFGPVAGIVRFKSEAEVVAQANSTEYGLASYFYTRDVARVWRVAEQLEFGMVGINTGLISNEVGPFGGIKQSGLGREGSRYGIDEYLEMKYLCMSSV
jgi:succinate-semialdehyde dehydrogenase/glutarate-semialdehyde dehydrogenase